MQNESYESLKARLNRDFNTREFVIENVGQYSVEDSDWNYKDVPHLNIVHSQVDSIHTWMDQKAIATINFQRVFFISLPLIVFNFEATKFNQVYVTSFWPNSVASEHEKFWR